MTRPAMKHFWAQHRLQDLLKPIARGFFVGVEFSFRATPEHEFHVADIGALSMRRMAEVNPTGHLIGSPELVIEVIDPSNTAYDMLDKRRICLEHGSREFWHVYPELQAVEIFGYEKVRVFRSGERIPVQLFGGAEIAVDDVFRVPELENL